MYYSYWNPTECSHQRDLAACVFILDDGKWGHFSARARSRGHTEAERLGAHGGGDGVHPVVRAAQTLFGVTLDYSVAVALCQGFACAGVQLVFRDGRA